MTKKKVRDLTQHLLEGEVERAFNELVELRARYHAMEWVNDHLSDQDLAYGVDISPWELDSALSQYREACQKLRIFHEGP
jgi:hypothetical protein